MGIDDALGRSFGGCWPIDANGDATVTAVDHPVFDYHVVRMRLGQRVAVFCPGDTLLFDGCCGTSGSARLYQMLHVLMQLFAVFSESVVHFVVPPRLYYDSQKSF